MESSKYRSASVLALEKNERIEQKRRPCLNRIIVFLAAVAGVGIAFSIPMEFEQAFSSYDRQSDNQKYIPLIRYIQKICGWSARSEKQEATRRIEPYLIQQKSRD